jgi:hypothetical protein
MARDGEHFFMCLFYFPIVDEVTWLLNFLLAYINCIKGFYYNMSVHTYNMLSLQILMSFIILLSYMHIKYFNYIHFPITLHNLFVMLFLLSQKKPRQDRMVMHAYHPSPQEAGGLQVQDQPT